MRIQFHNYVDPFPEIMAPKLAITWFHYNPKPDLRLIARNKYRVRMGLGAILDEGHDFSFEFWISARRIGFEIIFRDRKIDGQRQIPLSEP